MHVNELHGDAADGSAPALLRFRSRALAAHGRRRRRRRSTIDGTGARIQRCRPSPPTSTGRRVDIVLECTGKFRTVESLEPYFARGVRKVIVAAPVKDPRALNLVMGVNDHRYDPAVHDILTAASCTTNCLAPLVKVIHEGIGIRRGSITTLHDMTNTQTLVDAPHKDLRRARAASLSLIPTTTGSATAIGLIFPELEGKLDGLAIRVPLLNASLTDASSRSSSPTTIERSTRC